MPHLRLVVAYTLPVAFRLRALLHAFTHTLRIPATAVRFCGSPHYRTHSWFYVIAAVPVLRSAVLRWDYRSAFCHGWITHAHARLRYVGYGLLILVAWLPTRLVYTPLRFGCVPHYTVCGYFAHTRSTRTCGLHTAYAVGCTAVAVCRLVVPVAHTTYTVAPLYITLCRYLYTDLYIRSAVLPLHTAVRLRV